MRSFALISLTVALGSAACNDQESIKGSATEAASTTSDIAPNTTDVADTTTTTTGTTTTGTTTTGLVPTTGEPETTTTTGTTTTSTTTTGEPSTTTTTTTGEPDTTTGDTEGVLPPADNYEACDSALDDSCKSQLVCVDAASTNGQVQGSYCAPGCAGMMNCPKPKDSGPNTQAVCAFDTDGDQVADICALICNMANDDCGNGSHCEDIGIPPMMMITFGVCTYSG